MSSKIIKSIIVFTIIGVIFIIFKPKQQILFEKNISENSISMHINEFEERHEVFIKKNYWEGEDITTIASKLDKYLNSTLNNKGKFIAEYSIEVGLDPYLATAVMLQETGCYWTCSYLTRECNNVGGNKGNPSCGSGSYRKFDSIEEGIKFAINKLNNYYQKGLKTPKQINPKYAADKTWYVKVNNYINKLKSSKA